MHNDTYGPFSQEAQLTGVPITVVGGCGQSEVAIKDGDHTYHCEADRRVAEKLAQHLGRTHVRVAGTGTFERDQNRGWLMSRFTISSFEVLDERDLVGTVSQLREVTKRVGLDDDIIFKLAALRNDGPG